MICSFSTTVWKINYHNRYDEFFHTVRFYVEKYIIEAKMLALTQNRIVLYIVISTKLGILLS